jgi:hypothetical protein
MAGIFTLVPARFAYDYKCKNDCDTTALNIIRYDMIRDAFFKSAHKDAYLALQVDKTLSQDLFKRCQGFWNIAFWTLPSGKLHLKAQVILMGGVLSKCIYS